MLISISWLCPFIEASWDKKEPGAEHAAHWGEKHSYVKSHWDPLLTSYPWSDLILGPVYMEVGGSR